MMFSEVQVAITPKLLTLFNKEIKTKELWPYLNSESQQIEGNNCNVEACSFPKKMDWIGLKNTISYKYEKCEALFTLRKLSKIKNKGKIKMKRNWISYYP